MVHQPSGGFQGQASDIEIHAREIMSLRARLNDIYVHHTGQKLDVVEEAMERDKFLSPAIDGHGADRSWRVDVGVSNQA